jgi:hypothetical protein
VQALVGRKKEEVAFVGVLAPSLPPERLPHFTVGSRSSPLVRHYPQDQPIARRPAAT